MLMRARCCCCCCVTLSAVSAWSGLASTLGIKQKSVLSQVTSEDGSHPHPHAMHLNTHAAFSLPISSPPKKLIVFQSQKKSWYPWYCEDGWWLYFYDVSLWVVETGLVFVSFSSWHENMSKVEALMVQCVLDVKYESVLMLVWQYFDYNLLLSTIKQLMQPLSGYGLIWVLHIRFY